MCAGVLYNCILLRQIPVDSVAKKHNSDLFPDVKMSKTPAKTRTLARPEQVHHITKKDLPLYHRTLHRVGNPRVRT